MLKSDHQLLAQLRAGDERATALWFQTYQPRLTAYISRKLSQPLDVEELVQETFINCLRSLPNFKGNSSLYTWMCSIANHEVADYFRKRYAKKFIKALPLADFIFGDELKSNQSLDLLDAHQTAETINRVFTKIGRENQELLLLKYVDGQKVKEIARQFGRTPKAIESDLFRARRDFREHYLELTAADEVRKNAGGGE